MKELQKSYKLMQLQWQKVYSVR